MKSRFIEDFELLQLRSGFCDPSPYLPFEVALATGMRIGDVLKIRTEDIKNNRLYYIAQKTKKPASVRLKKSLAEKLLKNANGSSWCFPSPTKAGKHLTRQAAWARVKAAAVRAGLDPAGISPHAFRKTFAVDLFKNEGITAVMTALQHSNIQTTELYALSDFISGANAEKPLLRKDIPYIVARVVDYLKK